MALPPSDPDALTRFLADAAGAGEVRGGDLTLLAGGAIHENWGFHVQFTGGALDGEHELVLRTDAPTGVAASLSRVDEFAVLKAALAAGVSVPEPLFACSDAAVIGKPFFVMRRLPGTAQGRRITTDPVLEPALPDLAYRLGQELAQLQRIRPPRPDLAFLPTLGATEHIPQFRAYLERHPNPRPVLEWAIRWLEHHPPEPLPAVLCHRDFRTGNYLVEDGRLSAILDWEFAGWGDPDEDIGWFCCKGWRFARLDREAGGIADRERFYAGYEAASGRRLNPERILFWEVLANVRWAIIALQQSDRYLLGGARDLSTAIIGRRASECELELLMLLDQEGLIDAGPPAACRDAAGTPTAPASFGDLPRPIDLLVLGRELLLGQLLPLLPPERERELRLIATAMAITEREASDEDHALGVIVAELGRLYGPPACPGAKDARGHGAELLCQFAADLRRGAFEPCEGRARTARAILWRLTVWKLRLGNPQFLAANGFGE